MTKKRVILVVLDGWGLAPPGAGNAIEKADAKNFKKLWSNYPHSRLAASGNAVGVPEGQQGTSEIGHLHLGAGRVVWQPLEHLNRKIADRSFFSNPVLVGAMEKAKPPRARLHLVGLCSDGGIHSHINHLFALLEMSKARGLAEKTFIHFIADGRDVPEKSAMDYVKQIENHELGTTKMASIVGRYYAMDRDNNWDRTKAALGLFLDGTGFKAKTAKDAVGKAYLRGDKTDYYIQPTTIGAPPTTWESGDVVINFNFRTDRARQLSAPFGLPGFDAFEATKKPHYVCLYEYDPGFLLPAAFLQDRVQNNLGAVLSEAGKTQVRIAETDKYAHVTYFFNSQVEKPGSGETRVLVPSYKVPSYDQTPKMKAAGITKEAVKAIAKGYDFVLVNFANADLVGHSGVFGAVVTAIKTVDDRLGVLAKAAREGGYALIITADHGNAEQMLYPDGTACPSHTTNQVPFIFICDGTKHSGAKDGALTDVAPTILAVMGVEKPKEMTGTSLLA